MSRTALNGFPFGDVEKDQLARILRKLSKLYFCEVLGFCIMGNHFHLLVRMFPEFYFTDEDIKHRYVKFHGNDRTFSQEMVSGFRLKWESLSEFIKDIKQTFSRYYNKRHNRRGTLWGERFKSMIVEDGETLINCLAYIDLNPVRAAITERPEDNRWNSIGYHIQTGNRDQFLSLDLGLKEFGVLDEKERMRRYRRYVYEAGAIKQSGCRSSETINKDVLKKERKVKYTTTRINRFRYRTRYFSDSGIIGSKEFVLKNYQRFKDIFQSKHEKKPKPVKGLHGIYSLKRLAGA